MNLERWNIQVWLLNFNGAIGEGEQFWDIEFIDDLVIFRSFGGVYFYNPKEESITKMENPLGKANFGNF